jgi:hypothetical protein
MNRDVEGCCIDGVLLSLEEGRNCGRLEIFSRRTNRIGLTSVLTEFISQQRKIFVLLFPRQQPNYVNALDTI